MVNVCQTCGDEGFVEALVFCDSCNVESVHRYCLDITPVPFVDYITWFCEDCDGSDSGSDCNEVDQTAKLTPVLKKSEKKKKRKKKKRSSNDTRPVLADEDHELQDAMDVEPMKLSSSSPINEGNKDSKKQESSDIEKRHELTGLERNGKPVLEAENGASNLKESEKKKKKKKKSIKDTPSVLVDEDHELQDAMDVEPVKVSSSSPIKKTMKESKRLESSGRGKPHELTGFVRNGASVSEAGNSTGVLERNSCTSKKRKLSSVEKMKKKSSNATPPVLADEEKGLQGARDVEHLKVSSSSPIKETMEESIRRESLERNGASILEAENGASILKESATKKKKKKKKKSSNHTQPDLAVEDQEHNDATCVEPVKVSSAHNKETTKDSKRQESSDSRKPHELTDLIRTGASVSEAGNSSSRQDHNSDSSKKRKLISVEKKKKKKKKSSNLVLAVEHHGLQYATSVEPVKVSSSPMKETAKESTRWESSDSKEPHEHLVRNRASVSDAGNRASVLEKSDKKKKKKMKSSNNKPPDLAVEDHGLQDAMIVAPVKVSSPIEETMKESKRGESSNSGKLQLTGVVRNGASDMEAGNGASILEKSEKKKKKKKKKKKRKSSNDILPDLAVEDHGLKEATDVEPVNVASSSPIKETAKESTRQESADSRKSHGSTGLVRNEAAISEAGNSSSVPDHNSSASKKRKLSSDNKPVTTEKRHSASENSSFKEAESNMPQTSEGLTATRFNTQTLNQYRAQPIFQPIWRGSISIKGGNICSIEGLVVHVSSLACPMVHKTASSLQGRLSAEMFPRLEIWPLKSFLKNGGPDDGSIALYFFPSIESKDEKVFYSLILEMKKNDLAMRCVLDNADLLLFTSYTLPMDYWFFQSKEYLWGIFRRRQISRD